jgi:hypothetical protein
VDKYIYPRIEIKYVNFGNLACIYSLGKNLPEK